MCGPRNGNSYLAVHGSMYECQDIQILFSSELFSDGILVTNDQFPRTPLSWHGIRK